jgi:hypothetical protein
MLSVRLRLPNHISIFFGGAMSQRNQVFPIFVTKVVYRYIHTQCTRREMMV